MKRLLVSLALLALVVAVVSSAAAGTPAPLKTQLRVQKAKAAKLRRQVTAETALIASLTKKLAANADTIDKLGKKVDAGDQAAQKLAAKASDDAATIKALNAQVAALNAQLSLGAQAGLPAVLAGTPDDLWNAIVAIYAKFPTLADDQSCGYDKVTGISPGPPPNATDYTFTRWAGGC